MPRGTPDSLADRAATLDSLRQEAEAEAALLGREEASLLEQVRQAKEQVRYYEDLLVQLRRDWGRTPALTRMIRSLP